jgi:hypothetical protein
MVTGRHILLPNADNLGTVVEWSVKLCLVNVINILIISTPNISLKYMNADDVTVLKELKQMSDAPVYDMDKAH